MRGDGTVADDDRHLVVGGDEDEPEDPVRAELEREDSLARLDVG